MAANGRETLAADAEIVLEFQPVRLPVLDEGWAKHLARELHDGVAGELSTMLIDLERFRAAQSGRQGVLAEIAHLQEQVRVVLSNVRQLLYTERELPGVDPDFVGSLRRGLARRLSERAGLRVHVSASSDWPRDLPADTAVNMRRCHRRAGQGRIAAVLVRRVNADAGGPDVDTGPVVAPGGFRVVRVDGRNRCDAVVRPRTCAGG